MAVGSMDEILPLVKNEKLRQSLFDSKLEHEKLGIETHGILKQYDTGGKDPNPVAKSMSWLKTNVKMLVNPGDDTVADLMTEGCHMGMKSLSRYLNHYQEADPQAKSIAKKLIQAEERLSDDMRPFL